MHKHSKTVKKKTKKTKKAKKNEDFGSMPSMPSSTGYPDLSGGPSPYPSIEPPMIGSGGYPSLGEQNFSVPTTSASTKKNSTKPAAGYPSIGGGYPSIGGGYPSLDGMGGGSGGLPPSRLNTDYNPSSGPTYVPAGTMSYPSLDGGFGNSSSKPSSKPITKTKTYVAPSTSKLSYPGFGDGGDIVCDETEPSASLQMPYGGITMSKPDEDLPIGEN